MPEYNCPHCNHPVNVQPADHGKQLPCKHCGGPFTIPVPEVLIDGAPASEGGQERVHTELSSKQANLQMKIGLIGILLGLPLIAFLPGYSKVIGLLSISIGLFLVVIGKVET